MIQRDRLSAEFVRLATIPSPSLREGEIARYLIGRFRQLGAEVLSDDAGLKVGAETGNLIARWPACGREGEPIMFSVHMDTVEPCQGVEPILNDGVFTSAGETILGADDKAGIAELIEALEVVREKNIPHGPLEVVVTIGEEIGLVGAKHLDYSLIRSRRGYALDTSGTDRIILTAPGANKMRFEIIGQEAHAGICPECGLSAIAVASQAIATMRLGRIDEETTANIGTIQGGLATNIVPRSVVIEGEARSHDMAKLARQTDEMIACFEAAADTLAREIDGRQVRPQVNCRVEADYPRMKVADTADTVRLAREAAAAIGMDLQIRPGGGGSDANIFNQNGIETIIIGTGMTHVHSVEESVALEDMVKVASLLVEIVRIG